jgi:indoleamine 2,3-dioxygenase
MLLPIPKLQDYGIRAEYGFLPPVLPLEVLSDLYFSPWEAIMPNLPRLIERKQIRGIVDEMPILSTSKLLTESEWQRAYTVLCFIAHGYIWGDSPASERLPSSISIPLLEICAHLGTLPIITMRLYVFGISAHCRANVWIIQTISLRSTHLLVQ